MQYTHGHCFNQAFCFVRKVEICFCDFDYKHVLVICVVFPHDETSAFKLLAEYSSRVG